MSVAEELALEGVIAGYDEARVLFGADLSLAAGETVVLLGRNGAGKTTLIETIVGCTRLFAGSVRLGGREIGGLPPEARAKAGLGWVPQERNVFRSLTVEENLLAVARPGPWTPARALALFPRLRERRGHLGWQLSGGEQQMLAIARALMTNPRVLLLDEPLEGLAPVIVEELLAALARLTREEGTSVLLAEQRARLVLPLASRAVVLDRGRIVHDGPAEALATHPQRLAALLAPPAEGPRGDASASIFSSGSSD
ncbi:MAG: ABC transporter ATP-binding protein [Geminicoccaceae bacterium]|nr:ABC transporter ATP-binding protein [Geminicoccaceae bacterium]MDW8341741.1 ABC transporter ATP-binding protein [Geminicoccaceae bacterium]